MMPFPPGVSERPVYELNERELLLLLNQRMERIEAHFSEYAMRVQKVELRLVEFEHKIKIWVALAAVFGGCTVALFIKIWNF